MMAVDVKTLKVDIMIYLEKRVLNVGIMNLNSDNSSNNTSIILLRILRNTCLQK